MTTHNDPTHKSEGDKNTYWEKSQELMNKVKEAGGMESYLDNIPNLFEAFILKDKCVRCIDEGTPGGFHFAGSGILLSTEDKKAELQKIMEKMKEAGVDGVYSHEGCGAAKLFADTIKNDPDNYKNYAIEWAEKLASELGVPYKGHITELARPMEMHNARVVYYDGSGNFDPTKVSEIPNGFVISRQYLDSANAKNELAIALSIAMGHHGFGDLFTDENPLIIAPIEGRGISAEELNKEVEETISQYGGRVVIQGFSQPDEAYEKAA